MIHLHILITQVALKDPSESLSDILAVPTHCFFDMMAVPIRSGVQSFCQTRYWTQTEPGTWPVMFS